MAANQGELGHEMIDWFAGMEDFGPTDKWTERRQPFVRKLQRDEVVAIL